jgi:hypothetical protein
MGGGAHRAMDGLGKVLGIGGRFIEGPLSLFISSLGGKRSRDLSGSSNESGDHPYKPAPQTYPMLISNPLIPAFLVLMILLLLAFSTPVETWLTQTEHLPTLAEIFAIGRKKQPATLPKSGEDIGVWAKNQSGFYYCQGGVLFGDKPGKMMTQAEALMTGFRPADGGYCANTQPVVASDTIPSPTQQEPGAQDVTPDPVEASALLAKEPPGEPMAPDGVQVWVKVQTGLYYCKGNALFGAKPGYYMTQTDALVVGYQPSAGRCATVQSDQTSVAQRSPDFQQPAGSRLVPRVSKSPLAVPKEDKSVGVWAVNQYGFYYCRGDVLFGTKPGKLMTQSDALTAGFHPSDAACSAGKPNQKSAERLPPPQLAKAR